MMHFPRSLLLASALTLVPLHQASAQPAPSSAPPVAPPQTDIAAEPDAMSERAAENFREGVKLFRDKKFAQAEAAFEAAWALNKTHKTASNLGQAEMALNKHREAAEHFAFALRNAPAGDPVRPNNEKRLAIVKAQIGTLAIKVNVDGAEVLADGKKAGDAPLADPVFVDPGKVKVRVRLEGYTSWEKELDVTAGQEVPLDVTLAKPAPVPTATVSAPPPRSMLPAYVIGGVGLASLIAGGVLVGLAEGQRGDVRARMPRDQSNAPLCGQSAPAGAAPGSICNELRAAAETAKVMGNSGVAFFAIGGAAIAGAVVYWLWPAKSGAPAKASSIVVPMVGSDGGGLRWSGSF
jgi:hypothetical protein